MPTIPVMDQVVQQAARCVAHGLYSLDDLLVLLWSSVVAGHASHALYDAIAVSLHPCLNTCARAQASTPMHALALWQHAARAMHCLMK